MSDLPSFLGNLLASCPPAGGGVHNWLFRTARQLHAHRSPDEIVTMLAQASAVCGRCVPPSEIVQAVRNSLACAWHPSGQKATHWSPSWPVIHVPALPPPQPRWPGVDDGLRRSVLETLGGFALVDLWEESPIRLEEVSPGETACVLSTLFPGDPLLCVGRSSREFDTRRLSEWETPEGYALVVPSPMTAREGPRKSDGKPTAHSLANTGDRHYLVAEFDQGTVDEHAAILAHLSDFAPLVLAVHSGGKSLHGWFDFRGVPEEEAREFMAYAVRLGADPATFTRSQFVRMPGGTRDNGRRQVVWYFDPPPL